MAVADVSTVLWRERELLELLLFKLEEEQLVLTSGRSRWLGHATREVEMVVAQIREAELARAVLVDALAVGRAAARPPRRVPHPHRGDRGAVHDQPRAADQRPARQPRGARRPGRQRQPDLLPQGHRGRAGPGPRRRPSTVRPW